MAKKNWIQGAIKHPGALTRKAKRAGAMTKRGTINLDKLEDVGPQDEETKRQIVLARTLRKLRKRK